MLPTFTKNASNFLFLVENVLIFDVPNPTAFITFTSLVFGIAKSAVIKRLSTLTASDSLLGLTQKSVTMLRWTSRDIYLNALYTLTSPIHLFLILNLYLTMPAINPLQIMSRTNEWNVRSIKLISCKTKVVPTTRSWMILLQSSPFRTISHILGVVANSGDLWRQMMTPLAWRETLLALTT